MPTERREAASWAATVRPLEIGFFVKGDELPAHGGGPFSIRPLDGMPSTTQFFRVGVDLEDLTKSGEIWIVCTALSTGNREPPPGTASLDGARLSQVRAAVAAALPQATACFTIVDREGFSQVLGDRARAPAIAAAVAAVKYFAAWDESDPIEVTVADDRFAVTIDVSQPGEYRVLVRRSPAPAE
jgi:hypothetical protein